MDRRTARRTLPLLPLAAVLALPGSAQAFSFAAGPAIPVAHSNHGRLAAADFNGDGERDVAVSGNDSGTVFVSFGGMVAPKTIPIGNGATAAGTGDLNGDGLPDLIVAASQANKLVVRLSTRFGAFASAPDVPVGAFPFDVATADFDGDGALDVAVAHANANAVHVLLGNGDGSFGVPVVVPLSSGQYAIEAGDFNGDGAPDLVAAQAPAGVTSVALGDGNGGFAAAQIVSTTGTPEDVAVADLDRDGDDDVLLPVWSPAGVQVVRSNGDGTFMAPVDYPTGGSSVRLAAGDLDRDGHPDVAVPLQGSQRVALLRGDGAGGLSAPQHLDTGVGGSPTQIAIADMNGDGAADLLVGDGGVREQLSLFLNAPTVTVGGGPLTFGSAGAPVPQGTLSPAQTVTLTNDGPGPLQVAGIVFGGTHPDDFTLGSDSCRAPLAPGASCELRVRFAPQAEGARTATMTVLSNATGVTPVALSGTAGPLPQGPAGADGDDGAIGAKGDTGAVGAVGAAGAKGADGAKGDTGAQGPAGTAGRAGQVRVVTCTVTRARGKRKPVRRCTTKTLAGNATFTASGTAKASLSRGGKVVATGTASRDGGLRLRSASALPRGRYTLTLRYRQRGQRIVATAPLTVR